MHPRSQSADGGVTSRQVIGRPVFNVTVCGDDLEDQNEAIALQMNARGRSAKVQLVQATITLRVPAERGD